MIKVKFDKLLIFQYVLIIISLFTLNSFGNDNYWTANVNKIGNKIGIK
ncbi:MAG: hypothetical protein ABH873_03745 [Candidatus Firestonebacteria bacterium]